MLAINNFHHIVSHGGEIKKDLAWEQFIFYLSFTLFSTQFAQSCFEKGGVTKHGALDNLVRRSSRWGYQTNFCGVFFNTHKQTFMASCVVFSDLPQRLKSSNRELKTTHNTFQDHRVLYSDNNSRDSRIWYAIIFAAVLLHALLKRTRYRDRKNIYIISSVGWAIPYKIEILRASVLQVKLECLKYGRATLRTIRVPFRRTTG